MNNTAMHAPLTLTIIATGGTIAKTYANNGIINQSLVIDQILAHLRLPDLTIRFVDLLRIDSLDMNEAHRASIVKEALHAHQQGHAVIITHGTDTMVETGLALKKAFDETPGRQNDRPLLLTGAMLPFVMQGSDAVQNLTEALLAARILPAGVYIVLHNRILPLPWVRKNHQRGTFEMTSPSI